MADYRRYDYEKGNYNMSSSAYAYEYIAEDDEKEIEKKRARDVQKRLLIQKRALRMHRVKLGLVILAVFGGSLVNMASHALVVEQRIINTKLSDKAIKLQSENTAIQAEISDKVDMGYVEAEAIGRLGMTEPQPYQVVYVDVPKQSYTVQYDNEEEAEDEKFSLESFVGLFTK